MNLSPLYEQWRKETLQEGRQEEMLDFKARNARFISECPELLLQDALRRIKPIIV
mgnify:FL=1